MKRHSLKTRLMGGIAVAALVGSGAHAAKFDIPSSDLAAALDAYQAQSGVAIVVAAGAVKNVQTAGVKGDLPAATALSQILKGTGFVADPGLSGVVEIVRGRRKTSEVTSRTIEFAEIIQPAKAAAAGMKSVVVTSSKIKGDIQTVPIAITALSQEQLTARQIAGGPDLVKEVPNLTFSKTNFSGYDLEIRGIGTQAISVTTDPAVAVAFNDTPFIRNHFFEQEFYDVSQVEVLRGPQGTLYGRNATAGVVNVVSAKPTDKFEAMASADIGNYHNRRYEGMVNIPIVGDTLDLRVAGEWTKRDGYSLNQTTGQQIDGRDLWSSRVTLGWKPVSDIQVYFIWEHFQENDDRLRSGKQLCKTDAGPTTLAAADGTPINVPPSNNTTFSINAANFSQGCLPSSLYANDAFQVPNGYALPFVSGIGYSGDLNLGVDPYSQTVQSTNLRNIQSAFEPIYRVKNDTLELNTSWNLAPALTLYSDTGYNRDFLWSVEDYNRFNTSPGIFKLSPGGDPNYRKPDPAIPGAMVLCDPQLGCSDKLVVQDLSAETAWQFNQEFRLGSNFTGPLNFSAGGNYMHYETTEKYYVFSNSFTLFATNNCSHFMLGGTFLTCLPNGEGYTPPQAGSSVLGEHYVDSHPLTSLDDQGHNYFLSKNPYVLNSYAAFGEAYYDVTPDVKLTAGLRWTDDEKHFLNYPSQLLADGYGYPTTGAVDQKWNKWTGRAVANWSPKLDFTDQSLFYASYAHGYKAGGANPPGAVLLTYGSEGIPFPTHPLTFKPEFIDAYELGTKNTLLDGGLTLNSDVFFYNYKGYQISQIIDRTSVNLNFDATVRGAELEATYEPLPGLKFSFAGGYEDTDINKNQSAIDLMDRTAGTPGWTLMRPWVGQSSNCIFPTYVAAAILQQFVNYGEGNQGPFSCANAYFAGLDPVTLSVYHASWNGPADPSHNLVPGQPYLVGTRSSDGSTGFTQGVAYGYPIPISSQPGFPTTMSYPGFDPFSAPNGGQGFAKSVAGNELPGAPHFTASFTADYTVPVSSDWAATLHGDFYWQSQSWARVFNDVPYDKIRGYSNMNAALILTDASGWQVMGYVKNIFNTTAITGDFLNSDDSGLTTNVFLTDPRLYGIRVTKNFDGGDGGFDLFSGTDGKRPQVWLQLGGNYAMLSDSSEKYIPPFQSLIPDTLPKPTEFEKAPSAGFDWEGKLSYQPEDSDWVLKAGIRYGRSTKNKTSHVSLPPETRTSIKIFGSAPCTLFKTSVTGYDFCKFAPYQEFEDAHVKESERHTILDFTLGKDVGLGTFGGHGTSTIGAGVRVAQFSSNVTGLFNTDPHYSFPPSVKYDTHDVFNGTTQEKRSFHGIGPEITWDASRRLWGEAESGQLTFDMGVNAAILFGRQRANVEHSAHDCHHSHKYPSCAPVYTPATKVETFTRSRNVTVPNLGGYAGLSVRYNDAKISFGYRADEFFGAMDGGQATLKKYNRGFNGPYLNLSLGLGG